MGDQKRHKKHYFQKNKRKHFLEPGLRGFFCTCNFREKDCVKEAYNLLNEYADKLYPPTDAGPPGDFTNQSLELKAEEPTDIADLLKQEVEDMKKDSQKSIEKKRFQAVETGASNCVFIRTNLPHPEEIVAAILKDLNESKSQRTRYLLRLIPIMSTCKANLPDIMECAGKLLDRFFLKSSSTFAVIFNKRFNSNVSRDMIIKEIAELVVLKNAGNKADLKKPKHGIIVEVIKGICLISIVENYYEYKKFNLFEVCKTETKEDDMEVSEGKGEKEDCSPEPIAEGLAATEIDS